MFPLLLIMIGMGGALVLIAMAFSGPSPDRARARRLTDVRGRHSDKTTQQVMEAQLRRISAARGSRMDAAASRFMPRPAELKKRLEATGKDWTLSQYTMASGGLFLLTALALIVKGAPLLLGFLFGMFVGLGIPHMVLNFFIKRRITRFTTTFPDAIELLVRGLRSGLPITETMGVVAAEVPGPVGQEFRGVSDKMKIGRTLDVALQETAERLNTPEFQFFCITIAIQRETGGNLAETLANLADVLRKRSQMKLKIKAMSSESKASAYIVGSLPFIVFAMIWFINGSYMQNFFVDPRLMMAGIGGLFWMGLGAFIMAKMVNFEI